MATTNLCHAKHKDGRPVQQNEIKLGLVVEYPSPVGGTLDFKCHTLNDQEASFKSTHKEWPLNLTMKFNNPDFTLDEFIALRDAITAYDKCGVMPTEAQRMLVYRAEELGYAYKQSYTQASWTALGLSTYKELCDKTAN